MCLSCGLNHEEMEVSMQSNSKYFIVIAFVLALISYVLIQDKAPVVAVDAFLIPELQDKVNDVDAISLSQGQNSLDFFKQEGVWRIKQLNSFFADTNKIAQMLLSLRKFKLKQPKTSNVENYSKLGLAEPQAIKVVLKNKGKVFADFYIGKQAMKVQGTYVRKNSDKQSWLSTGQLSIKLDKDEWMIKNIIDVDASQVQSVSYQPVNETGFKIAKKAPTDKDFILETSAKELQLKPVIELTVLANGLSTFTIKDVVNDISIDESSLVNVVSYQLFSGATYNLKLYTQADKHYLKIDVKNVGSLKNIEKQLNKWLFTLPQFKFDALNKKNIDILEDKSKQKEEN